MSNLKNTTASVEQIEPAVKLTQGAINNLKANYADHAKADADTRALAIKLADTLHWRCYPSPQSKNKGLALLKLDAFNKLKETIHNLMVEHTVGFSDLNKSDKQRAVSSKMKDFRNTAMRSQAWDLFSETGGNLEFVKIAKIDGVMTPVVNKEAMKADADKKEAAKNKSKAPRQPVAPVNDKQFVETALTLSNALHGYVSKYGKDVAVAPSSVAVVIEQSLDCKETLQRILTDMSS